MGESDLHCQGKALSLIDFLTNGIQNRFGFRVENGFSGGKEHGEVIQIVKQENIVAFIKLGEMEDL